MTASYLFETGNRRMTRAFLAGRYDLFFRLLHDHRERLAGFADRLEAEVREDAVSEFRCRHCGSDGIHGCALGCPGDGDVSF